MRLTPLRLFTFSLLAGLAVLVSQIARAQVDPRVLAEEKKRIAVVEKVRPAVVAIFGPGGNGGGSGVLISKDGYCLTNFHVVGGSGPTMKCGLPDGILYDAVLVGLDKVGDVALIKLLPQKVGDEFPFAAMGDSDKVQAGDWSLAMGNPFLLATDFTPTVTFGLVSGVHRYQYPEGKGLLEYTDCIQIDTSINPGNSGGPLFNMDGELVGINGRGSFDKRGRVNSGVGYAISINQIKNFMGHLRAGIDADHATLGATVETARDEDIGAKLVVRAILDECDAHRRGLEPADELVEFSGRPMTSTNQFQNVLGIYPRGWRVPLTYRRNNEKREVLVRLMGKMPRDLDAKADQPAPKGPMPKINPAAGPGAKMYEAKAGFANYFFNKQERDRLVAGFKKHGDFAGMTGEWGFEGTADLPKKKGVPVKVSVKDDKVHLTIDVLDYKLDPLKTGQELPELKQPASSGGLAMALYNYSRLMTLGEKGFVGHFNHGGNEPFYPPKVDGPAPKSPRDLRVDTEVLQTEHASVTGKWHFAQKDQTLLGFETTIERGEDPCEIYLYDYKPVDGKMLPHKIEVRSGNDRFATFTITNWKLSK